MSSLFERNRMIVQLKLLESGVVPVSSRFLESPIKQVRAHLSTLSQEERRKATRKFRKLHRKTAKELMRNSGHSEKARARGMNELTLQKPSKPTPRCHNVRNREVWQHFMQLAATGKI